MNTHYAAPIGYRNKSHIVQALMNPQCQGFKIRWTGGQKQDGETGSPRPTFSPTETSIQLTIQRTIPFVRSAENS